MPENSTKLLKKQDPKIGHGRKIADFAENWQKRGWKYFYFYFF
jgi:hypothetical protein